MVIVQRNVDNDKTNEILAFAPLLEPLDLAGKVVTVNAMHTQRKGRQLRRRQRRALHLRREGKSAKIVERGNQGRPRDGRIQGMSATNSANFSNGVM
jgi:predicted transposase YbfD/YdcC